MLTGVIQPIPRTRSLDRSDTSYTLWESNPKPNVVELPWPTAAAFDSARVRDLLASAKTVIVASARPAIFEQVLASLRPGMRAYGYGPPQIEAERALVGALGKDGRMNMRLGFEPPADWVVVDGGRDGVLFVGPPGEERRWAVPLEPTLARALFEAFRVLFWFHARREGLPDASRVFGFRPPLAAPYRDPGKDVPLPSGRLVIDGALADLVPDAEFRVVPDGAKPGRTATALCPPNAKSFDVPRQLVATGVRVVWADTGLPPTTVSRQRLVMDLVAAPVAIQLEWGSGTAVDTFHRLTRACESPKWTFHMQRRLADIAGPVLLEGASAPASVRFEERIDLPDLRAPLASFETAEPTSLQAPSPLTRTVIYGWRTLPEAVPAGASKAVIVRQWTALDEWAGRTVEVLRQRLAGMEGEERSFMDRLRGLLRGQDAVQRERARIREALTEIAEQPPSQRTDAVEVVRRLQEESGKINGLVQQAHVERQRAEDDADEAEKRKQWEIRVATARDELTRRRATLADLEAREVAANTAVQAAEDEIQRRTGELRAARLARLTEARDRDEALLAETKAKLKELDTQHRGKAPKEERKVLTTEIARVEPLLAATKRDLLAMERWSPPVTDLMQENIRLKQARDARGATRKEREALTPELARLETASTETFAWREGARLPPVSLPVVATAPTVPSEAPPELGELFEHQGARFLAVRTWEQVNRAERVATRLRAELVAFPDASR